MCAALAASNTTCTDSKPRATADQNACSAVGLQPDRIPTESAPYRTLPTPRSATRHTPTHMRLLPALRHVSSTQKSRASPQTKSRFLERTASCHTAGEKDIQRARRAARASPSRVVFRAGGRRVGSIYTVYRGVGSTCARR